MTPNEKKGMTFRRIHWKKFNTQIEENVSYFTNQRYSSFTYYFFFFLTDIQFFFFPFHFPFLFSSFLFFFILISLHDHSNLMRRDLSTWNGTLRFIKQINWFLSRRISYISNDYNVRFTRRTKGITNSYVRTHFCGCVYRSVDDKYDPNTLKCFLSNWIVKLPNMPESFPRVMYHAKRKIYQWSKYEFQSFNMYLIHCYSTYT